MSKKYRLYQVDSFTKTKFLGNPAGVIANADGLSVKQMQRIARELNNSETAFIFSSYSDDYDVQVRFFTPTKEVPICGHATIAAHYIRAIEKKLKTGRVYQKTGAGILPVDILKNEDDYTITMTQGEIEFQTILAENDVNDVYKALGIKASDAMENCPVQIISTGHSKVMVGIKDLKQLHELAPNMALLSEVSERIDCNGFYVFKLNEDNSEILVHGRMFAPAIGIMEDPVTGNANGPLGAYLVKYGLTPNDGNEFKFRAMQGGAIGRKGVIDVCVTVCEQRPTQVKITGEATIVFQTELEIN